MRPSWVTRQIDDFVQDFARSTALIGAETTTALLRAHMTGQDRYDGRIETSPDLSSSEGFVWRPAAADRLPQLWLDPGKTGYRAAFERFAIRELGAPGLDGADVHIDHVFPKRAAAMGGLGYVRMLAVPPESNMAAGRTLEKAMVGRNAQFGRRAKDTRLATYFSIGKATGFDGYAALPDGEPGGNWDLAVALFAHLRAFGVPAEVLNAWDVMLTADRATDYR
ncbi:hypothetical protein GXW74_22675 [Roseomonas eburnea]|uniref:Uncharacterized protein n=1 Tax=Neoroseomonas eburnea TaxID=1346889 RepID=A0A9X9XHX2_9PROT|nr:hypothetical protein [Neoroseomonas eburnea]MBR0683308.1 hypothetical protein [Neoroseomonas eburnea]